MTSVKEAIQKLQDEKLGGRKIVISLGLIESGDRKGEQMTITVGVGVHAEHSISRLKATLKNEHGIELGDDIVEPLKAELVYLMNSVYIGTHQLEEEKDA